MAKKRALKSIPKTSVKIFKIANRRGFAALCRNCLTEGSSPIAAYARMQKAVRRTGVSLPDILADAARSMVRKAV